MSDATESAPEVDAAQQNGKPAPAPAPPEAQGLQLPEGTITLPPPMVARLTRILQQDPHVHDVLYAFIEGKGETGPYSLVLPVVLLVRPQQPPGG